MQSLSRSKQVYDDADYVGSLVVQGETGRPTEYDGPKQEPPDWWADFWHRYQQNTGQTPSEALAMLRRIRPHWHPESEDELRDALEDARRSSGASD